MALSNNFQERHLNNKIHFKMEGFDVTVLGTNTIGLLGQKKKIGWECLSSLSEEKCCAYPENVSHVDPTHDILVISATFLPRLTIIVAFNQG